MTEITIFQGFLGRDVAIRETEKGKKIASFSVCSTDYFAGKEKNQWFDCAWFDFNSNITDNLKKGSCVNIVGTFDDSIETGKDGKPYLKRTVFVDRLGFASSTKSNKDEAPQQAVDVPAERPSVKKEAPTPPSDEEITTGVNKKKFAAESDDNNNDLPF